MKKKASLTLKGAQRRTVGTDKRQTQRRICENGAAAEKS